MRTYFTAFMLKTLRRYLESTGSSISAGRSFLGA